MTARSLPQAVARNRDWRQLTVLLAFGLSGLCALAYQVVWFRLLGTVFESLAYALAIMLATVLLGIAAGSWIVGPFVDRLVRRNWLWISLAFCQFAIAAMALFSVRVLASVQGAVALLASNPLFVWTAGVEDRDIFLAALVAILPAMLFSGATFPIAAALYAGRDGDDTRGVGRLYAGNLVGAIIGSLLGGFVLLPLLGSQTSLIVLAMGSTTAGLAVLLAAPRRSPLRNALVGLAAVGAVGLLAWTTPNLSERMLASRFPGSQILFFKEGLESSVTVIREPDGYLTLFTNSRGQSRDEPGLLGFHRLVGHLPAALHPNPQRSLVVGMGAGSTAGSLLQYPGNRVDVAELSDGVIEAARWFGHSNYAFFEDPRVTIRQADARNHLLLTDTRYDVVAGDAIRPNDAGSATLYSVEYFKLVASALEDDGLMALWLPPFSEYQYKLILRTFLEAFPYATLWQNGDLLIGAKQPLRFKPDVLEQRMQDPALRRALGDIGVTSPAGLLGKFQAGPDELRAYAGPGPLITDDLPSIEYFRSLPKDGPPVTRWSKDAESVVDRTRPPESR